MWEDQWKSSGCGKISGRSVESQWSFHGLAVDEQYTSHDTRQVLHSTVLSHPKRRPDEQRGVTSTRRPAVPLRSSIGRVLAPGGGITTPSGMLPQLSLLPATPCRAV